MLNVCEVVFLEPWRAKKLPVEFIGIVISVVLTETASMPYSSESVASPFKSFDIRLWIVESV
jgi:hypothetical protein